MHCSIHNNSRDSSASIAQEAYLVNLYGNGCDGGKVILGLPQKVILGRPLVSNNKRRKGKNVSNIFEYVRADMSQVEGTTAMMAQIILHVHGFLSLN